MLVVDFYNTINMAVRKTKKGLALKRWFKEDWRTPKGKKGYSKGDSGTFRPTKKVSADTPDTYSELSPSDLAAAKAERKAIVLVAVE